MSSAYIDCFECVDYNALPEVNLHVACESPDAVFKKTYCGSPLRGCVEEILTNTTDQTQLTYRYCIQRGNGGDVFESPTGRFIATDEIPTGTNTTSCIRENSIDIISDICTCTEDLCNYDGCSTCEEYCNVQADDPIPEEVDVDAKAGGITCMQCLDPNSVPGETRCGLPGVEEFEDYCGDDAIRACVEINVNPIGIKFRRCLQKAVEEFPEYFVGLRDVATYSSDMSTRGCNILQSNGGNVTTCICNEDRCNSPCTVCETESCSEEETTTTTTTTTTKSSTALSNPTSTDSSEDTSTSTPEGSGQSAVAYASPLAVSAVILAMKFQ